MSEIPNLEILNRPATAKELEKPKLMPQGWYHAVVTSYASGSSKEKKTPYIEYTPTILGPTEEIDPAALQDVNLKGLTFKGPSNRGGTFYVTDKAIGMLHRFHKSLGFDPEGSSAIDIVPQVVGKEVLVQIKHVPSKTRVDEDGNPEMFATLEQMKGA